MKSTLKIHLMLFLCLLSSSLFAQVTTSGISGKVISNNEVVIGATVIATHEPSGTTYGTVTNTNGRFNLHGMRTGGPYKVTISYIGYQTSEYAPIHLLLGEIYTLDAVIKESSEFLEEVTVIASKDGLFNSQRTGAAQNFNREKISATPSVSKSIFDVTKMTPQGVNTGSGMSFAGASNKFNSFQIDGIVNNDVFGLSSSGTNGGQAGANPISLEAIEEVQVVIAPFDVRQSGFTGGGVNAITKSGTNKFNATVYSYYNNESFIGKTAGEDVKERKRLSKQSSLTYGASLSGAIIENKLFYFFNVERVNDTYPSAYNVGEGSLIAKENADKVLDHYKAVMNNYDAGGYGERPIDTKSTKMLARVDWNINESNKLTLRYNLLDGSRLSFGNSINNLNFNHSGYVMNNQTHSIVGELNTKINETLHNELRFGYTRVKDRRKYTGSPAPRVVIENVPTADGKNKGKITLGSENFSVANGLDQDIFTLEDNLSLSIGSHSITFGTHNELFNMGNLFIRNRFGNYTYNNIDDFVNDKKPKQYELTYAPDGKQFTDDNLFLPNFSSAQLGFYVQDDWSVLDNLKLTYGLRLDVPLFFTKPEENEVFNKTKLAAEYNVAVGSMPGAKFLLSPRVGFRYNLDEERRHLLRGGVGMFTGRVPFVWISNNFSNTGMGMRSFRLESKNAKDFDGYSGYQGDPNSQWIPSGVSTQSSEINVIDNKFKFPQVLRGNLAFESRLPYDVKLTLEGLYSKTMNDIYYQNLAVKDEGATLKNGGDKRTFYSKWKNADTGKEYRREYNGVYYLTNTSKGYTYNLSAKLEKDFDFGLGLMAAYTFGRSKSINDGGSSQASSNWRYNSAINSNSPSLEYTRFDVPHRVIALVSYTKKYAKNFGTSVSLFYQGQSGSRYSMIYDGDINNDTRNDNDVLYIPTDKELTEMKFFTDDKFTVAEGEQRAAFGNWINENPELAKLKGDYVRRNALIGDFENHFDFRIAQDFYIKVSGNRTNTLQVAFDILNVGNLLNSAWGLYNYVGYSYKPLKAKVNNDGEPQFQFNKGDEPKGISDFNSRWRSQLSVKYIF